MSNRSGINRRASALALCSGAILTGGLIAGCADTPGDDEPVSFNSTEQDITPAAAAGDPLPGITATDFNNARASFNTQEGLDDGLGPIMNETACGHCHTQGSTGGAGVQIESRFGRFVNGVFDTMASSGGSLRQLMTVGSFTGSNGKACTVPLEVIPSTATVRAGRLTTPLFGAGLIDTISDATIAANQSAQATAVRGVISRVKVLLPNPADSSQVINGTRSGKFGWKAQIASLVQFSADAYLNEMGITTQHCIGGNSVLSFATESKPNGVAQPAGCDDRGPGGAGIPAGTDDGVGTCASGQSEIQDDVDEFFKFMTFLAPVPRLPIDANTDLAGGTAFSKAGCADCHLLKDYVTPAHPANGVPANFKFRPRTDFLLHDMGSLGDSIGNDGDSPATTRLMRTAPLWGLHVRTKFLHDGRASNITDAIHAHAGQAAASVTKFDALSSAEKTAMLTAMNSD
ncbi:MAG TPA: di-heme oxidoredictase family protein [Kofleriaceae bacterium]|jgi:CxxC motif-containing protein (DUF1111 family)|nr:di-heme oxidoredictase family protein [Kofleriaceae bacterium]